MTTPPAPPPTLDEVRRLVERIQQGDDPQGNLKRLFWLYHRRVSDYFKKVTGDAVESEDLTQETFKRVYLHIGMLDDPSRFAAWLKKIMIRVYHDWLRNDRWRGRLVPIEALGPPDRHPALSARRRSPLESLLAWERQRALRRALRRAVAELPPRQRQCILLRSYHGLRLKEIAQFMGISIGAVQAHLHQARASLASRLGVARPPKDTP